MSCRYAPVKLRIPKGFSVLLEMFTKEVLREQPENIADFGAVYFERLLEERKMTGVDRIQEIEKKLLKDGFNTSTDKPLRPKDSASRIKDEEEKTDSAARKIQKEYRKYRQKKQDMMNETAATTIQAGYRGYRTRKLLHVDPIKEEDDTKEEQKPDSPVPFEYGENANEAAVTIQAGYRGYRARQVMNIAKSSYDENIALDESESQPEHKEYGQNEEDAAVRIQANYRGYQTRKSLKHDRSKKVMFQEPEVEDSHTEEMPDLTDPEVQAAALKIQASFRGHLSKKKKKSDEDPAQSEEEAALADKDSEEQKADESEDLDSKINTEESERDDPAGQEDLDEEVTLKKDEVTLPKDEEKVADEEIENKEEDAEEETPKNVDEEIPTEEPTKDLDKDAAATKIQANYRGYRSRKQMKKLEPEGDAV